jgi:hypothetical protein
MFKEEMEIGYVVGIHVCFPEKNVTWHDYESSVSLFMLFFVC